MEDEKEIQEDQEDETICLISESLVQEYAESNFQQLTKEEIGLVKCAFWDNDETVQHIDEAVLSAIEYALAYKQED